MFAVTGITGNVGGEVARNLLDAGQPVRGVVRETRKAETWAKRGCDLVEADINDAAALTAAFEGAAGVFVLVPSNFDPSPDFREARAVAAALRSALDAARPSRVVYLSTIGAQATRLEPAHAALHNRAGAWRVVDSNLFLAAWMVHGELGSWDVAPAARNGVFASFLQPLDKPVPMVATADIGRVAAELIQTTWNGRSVVELEGPHRVTPEEIAATFADLLGRPVQIDAVPRETWESLFQSQGMKNPAPRIQMLDGFNQGWIEFESGEAGSRKGRVELRTALQRLIERESRS